MANDRAYMIKVTVIDLESGDVEHTKIVNISTNNGWNHLRRIQFRAWNNNKGVATALDKLISKS